MTHHPLQNIKAVFWDWDGTLVDSFAFLHKTHNHVRSRFGMDVFTTDVFKQYFGRPREILYREIYGAENIALAKQHFEEFVVANHHEIQAVDGAKDVLAAFADMGIPMAVVTNKKGELVQKEIVNHGWNDFFVCTVGAGEAAEDKPSSAPLFHAIEKGEFGLSPNEILFVGDTENDLICAHTAGAQIAFIHEDEEICEKAQKYKPLLIFRNYREFHDFLLQST